MAINGSHPGCFMAGARLYAVPSDTGHDVAETQASWARAGSPHHRRPRIHWSVVVGGVAGGILIDASAIRSSNLADPVALMMMFVLGGLVGFASAYGIREACLGREPEPEVARLPAVEIPGDVARGAPDDATADELVLWSVVTKRYRAALAARDDAPFVPDPRVSTPSSTGATTSTAAEAGALAELAYITARHDFEPVAELLGLATPR
ncbi:hypothetical protein [Frondihabitans sp. VKM Ac-2883]|uniref:hypothetical protein n=1 Tax=Frondihabitans sp. VKM Ac-2883 TaxID=2783823 RepID=UPI00188BA075|nr:hypothetical protein [Frondihabitans sp. VKM Ac-2883]MBF4576555.1 hypothetical protein [Frondihabitans sp. VKM Ac-2883]